MHARTSGGVSPISAAIVAETLDSMMIAIKDLMSVRAIALPGHTPGSTGYLLRTQQLSGTDEVWLIPPSRAGYSSTRPDSVSAYSLPVRGHR